MNSLSTLNRLYGCFVIEKLNGTKLSVVLLENIQSNHVVTGAVLVTEGRLVLESSKAQLLPVSVKSMLRSSDTQYALRKDLDFLKAQGVTDCSFLLTWDSGETCNTRLTITRFWQKCTSTDSQTGHRCFEHHSVNLFSGLVADAPRDLRQCSSRENRNSHGPCPCFFRDTFFRGARQELLPVQYLVRDQQ